jgi:enoyl-CoA hydratase
MARTPADVFAFSKRQLQQPARDALTARAADDDTVLKRWLDDRTRQGIAGYLESLRTRAR